MSATSTYNSNKNDDSLDNVYWLTLQQQIRCMIMLDRLMSDQLYVVRTNTDVQERKRLSNTTLNHKLK